MHDKRIAELEEWELETGRALPYTPVQILRLEDTGHVVNLETGEVTPNAEDKSLQYRLALLLRMAGKWDGVSELAIVDAPRLWAALNAGDLHIEELQAGVHYTLEPARATRRTASVEALLTLPDEQLELALSLLERLVHAMKARKAMQEALA